MSDFSDIDARNRFESAQPIEQRSLPRSIYASVKEVAERRPEGPAFSLQMTGSAGAPATTWTWRTVHSQVVQWANALRALGVGADDTVAYLLPNSLETIVTFLGGMVAGTVVPLNPLLEPERIAGLLQATGAKVLVTLKPLPKTDLAEKAAQVASLCPALEAVVEVDLARHLPLAQRLLATALRPRVRRATSVSYHDFGQLVANASVVPPEERSDPDRVVACFHTGGTTGTPKLVEHTAGGVIFTGWLGQALLMDADSVLLCPLPLFHVFGCHAVVMSAVLAGAHVVLPTPAGFRGPGVIENFWALIERWRATFVIAVPTAMSAMLEHPVNADVSSVELLVSGSAPLPQELYRRFEAATGIEVVEGYGLTEATALVSANPIGGTKKIGSVGIPFPYVDLRVRQETEAGWQDCTPGVAGEICVRGPGVRARGVYRDAQANVAAMTKDGYLRTGDLGRFDEDGYLWLTGRAKDLIIRGGHNIDPLEIETAVSAHPAVALAAAVGQPDQHAGEVPCLYVTLVEGQEVDGAVLLAYAHEHINERAAWPKHLEVLPDLPVTAVGKISKLELRCQAVQRVYQQALADAGLPCEVARVVPDKTHGLLAAVDGVTDSNRAAVNAALSEFIYAWG
ncbi:MAG: acyl-CoA synthetase [Pseudomonadota bacterium]